MYVNHLIVSKALVQNLCAIDNGQLTIVTSFVFLSTAHYQLQTAN